MRSEEAAVKAGKVGPRGRIRIFIALERRSREQGNVSSIGSRGRGVKRGIWLSNSFLAETSDRERWYDRSLDWWDKAQ
jgi:hypothetical protein